MCELEWDELPITDAAKSLVGPYSFTEDRRGTVTEMRQRFPGFNFEGLAETDEIWREDYNETKAEQLGRTRRFLDMLFDSDDSSCTFGPPLFS